MEKEKKKSFWASIFAPKPSCCCESQIEEIKEDNEEITPKKANEENDEKNPPCDCGGKCN